MINETALRDVLVILAESHRNQYALLNDLGAELAALKETMRVLDPTFSETFAIRKAQAMRANEDKGRRTTAQLDGMIQKLKAGLVS